MVRGMSFDVAAEFWLCFRVLILTLCIELKNNTNVNPAVCIVRPSTPIEKL